MTALVAIRTHRWGPDAARLHAQLAPVLGDRLVTVFHGTPPADLPLAAVALDDAWLAANGLRGPADWGWRCGDYFLYALRRACPGADHYWLIEPDVLFSGDPAGFFAATDALAQDVLGVRVGPMRADHRFSRGLPGMAHHRAIFALVRFSGRAIDRLFPLRQAYAAGPTGPRFFANDEVFCFSHALADPDLSVASLADLVPDWFADDAVQTDPDILDETLAGRSRPGVFHPVRSRDSFRGALAARLAGNTGFLRAMAPSLALLSEDDLAAIAQDVARESLAALRAARPQPPA